GRALSPDAARRRCRGPPGGRARPFNRPAPPGGPRREFVRAGFVTAGAAVLGAYTPAFAIADPASSLDDLARRVRGRLLRGSSPGYDEARKVWNLAYDRRPIAMVRASNIDDVRRCVEFASKHTVPIAI